MSRNFKNLIITIKYLKIPIIFFQFHKTNKGEVHSILSHSQNERLFTIKTCIGKKEFLKEKGSKAYLKTSEG